MESLVSLGIVCSVALQPQLSEGLRRRYNFVDFPAFSPYDVGMIDELCIYTF